MGYEFEFLFDPGVGTLDVDINHAGLYNRYRVNAKSEIAGIQVLFILRNSTGSKTVSKDTQSASELAGMPFVISYSNLKILILFRVHYSHQNKH